MLQVEWNVSDLEVELAAGLIVMGQAKEPEFGDLVALGAPIDIIEAFRFFLGTVAKLANFGLYGAQIG